MMPWAARWQFALRQTAGSGRGLSGFLSKLSMLGLILAVAVLLAVLSVMNGFEREMRERILGLVPHVSIRGYTELAQWQRQRDELEQLSEVRAAELFFERDGLAVQGSRVFPAQLLGVSPHALARWQPLLRGQIAPVLDQGVVLGSALAQRLGVVPGDNLRMILPATPRQEGPRARPVTLNVVATLTSGTEFDQGLVLADFTAVAEMTGATATATGVALQLHDLFQAPVLRHAITRTLPGHFYVTDWTATQGNLYAAIQLSRDLVTLLLLSIIAVAAFNVVSSLVLVVNDRRMGIAMLRTLGATPGDIVWIFLLHGALIGILGASLGLLAGYGLALAAPALAGMLEWVLGLQLLNTDIYPLSFLPVDIRARDGVVLWIVSVSLCLLAALIPARRAARVPVAQIMAAASR